MAPLLNATAGGNVTPASLPKFVRVRPMSHLDVTNRAWKLLVDADLPRKVRNGKNGNGHAIPLSESALCGNERAIAALQVKLASESDPAQYALLEKLISVYENTFTYMEVLGAQFVSTGGPHQIFCLKYKDTQKLYKERIAKPGLPGRLEKYMLPVAGGLITGGALVATGVLKWAALKLLKYGFDPALVEGTIGISAMGIVAAGIKVGLSSLVSAASKKRRESLGEAMRAKLEEIGNGMQEVKKAIVQLAGLEYMRLIASSGLFLSPVQDSAATIAQRMAEIVVSIRQNYGIELALPVEVESVEKGYLQPVESSKLAAIAKCIHAHLATLFKRHSIHGPFDPFFSPCRKLGGGMPHAA